MSAFPRSLNKRAMGREKRNKAERPTPSEGPKCSLTKKTLLAVAGRPFRKGGAQRNGAWPGARVPAARAAVDGTDDMPVSDSGTHSCESDSGSGTSAAPPHNILSIVVCEGFPVVS